MIQMVCACIGTILAILWLYLFFTYRNRYNQYINAIEEGIYLFPSLFFIGYGFINKFHMNINSKSALREMKLFAELKGVKYCRFYYQTNLAGQITYVLTLSTIGFLLAAITDIGIAAIIVVVGFLLAIYLSYDVKKRVDERREEIMQSFPHVLSKMSLLINAGMTLREVIDRIANAKEKVLYKEFGIMQAEIQNGVSEYLAMQNLASRCGVQEIRKFVSIMVQNMEKGSSEMANSLIEMSEEVWAERKSNVRQMGEKTSAKLMLPIMMIFAGIMIMILVPMLSTMSL